MAPAVAIKRNIHGTVSSLLDQPLYANGVDELTACTLLGDGLNGLRALHASGHVHW
jgi:hypothetical protein